MTRLPPLALILGWLSACSSEPITEGAGAGGASASAGGQAGKAAAERCPDGPGRESQTEVVEVGVVQGRFVDPSGEPVEAGLVQICGKDICVNADVGPSGELYQNVSQAIDAPACKFGDGRSFGKLAFPIEGGDVNLGTITAVPLPDLSQGASFEPGESVTSSGVSLRLSRDTRVEVDTLTYANADEHVFRAARLPDETLALLGEGFLLGFALAPVETQLCPAAALSIDNLEQLAPGTELELYQLGLDVSEEWAPYAGWQKVGEGAVTGDGSALEFQDGLPLLTAIAIREKP
jgi:hypothetical protein